MGTFETYRQLEPTTQQNGSRALQECALTSHSIPTHRIPHGFEPTAFTAKKKKKSWLLNKSQNVERQKGQKKS